MKLKKYLAFPVLSLTLAACGSSSSSDDSEKNSQRSTEPPTEPFIDASTIEQPVNLTALSATQFDEIFPEYFDYFLATEASSTSGADSDDFGNEDFMGDCTQKEFDKSSITAEGSKYTISINVDLRQCIMDSMAGEEGGEEEEDPFTEEFSISVTSASFKVFVQADCTGADFSEYNGKPFSEWADTGIGCPGAGSILVNTHVDMNMSMVFGEASMSIVTSTREAISTADNKPCVISAEGETLSFANSCQHVISGNETEMLTGETA